MECVIGIGCKTDNAVKSSPKNDYWYQPAKAANQERAKTLILLAAEE